MKSFKEFTQYVLEAIEAPAGSKRTQLTLKDFDPERDEDKRATTLGTYRNSAAFLKDKLPENSTVLDYGAGAGQGAQIMRKKLPGHKVETYEPQPEGWKPDYENSDDIKTQVDALTAHNLLNAVPKNIRGEVTDHMLSLVRPGGHIITNARKWKGDVQNSEGKGKNKPGDEDKSMLVHDKKTDSYTFHKGFDGNDLLDHMKSHDPEGNFEFKRNGDRVIGKRIK